MIPAAAASPAVSRSLQARFERAVLLLVWVGILGFTLASDSYVYLACATVAVVVHFVAVLIGRDIRLRRALVTVAALGAGALATVEVAYLGQIMLVAAAHFLLMLQVCKLFESRRSRDCAQLLGMNVLLMVSAALLVDKLWMAVVLVAYTGLFCYVSVLYTLKRGLEMVQARHAAAGADDDAGPRADDDGAVVTAMPRGAAGLRAALLLVVLVQASVAVFVLVPRGALSAERMLGLSVDRRATMTGFKPSVELTGSKAIYESDRVAMQVTVHLDEPTAQLDADRTYLRGAVLTHYADSRWYTPDQPPPLSRGRLRAPGSTILGETDRFNVLLQPALLPTLFAPYPSVWVGCQMDRQQLKNSLVWGYWGYDAAQPPAEPVWYVAHCLRRPLHAEQRNYVRAAEGPVRPAAEGIKVPRRVRDLAAEWCADLLAERGRSPARRGELDLAVAQRIASRLRQRCSYTLSVPPVDASRDGVEYFLFEMRQGHCEYFASALTVMCRALDVPARLVAGFRMLERGRQPGEYVVRDRDAHAWTEVYVPPEGWVTLDATPSGRARRKGDSPWAVMRNAWDDLQLAWASRVAAYDNTSRARLANLTRRLVEAVVNAGGPLSDRVRDLARRFLRTTVGMVTLGLAIAGLVSAGGVAGVLCARYLRRRRRRAGAWRRAGKVQMEFLGRLIRLLEARGLKRRPSHTVREVLDLASQRFSLPADVLAGLVAFYYACRWGGRAPTRRQMAAAKRQAEQIACRLVRPGRPPRRRAGRPEPSP